MSGKNKNTIVITYFVIAVIFVVLFIVVPFEKNPTTWVAFAFGCISIIAGAIVSYSSFDKGNSLKSKVYGFPMFRLGYYYMIVQLILVIALFVTEFFVDIPFWIAVVFGLVLLGALIIGFTAIDNTREIIQQQEKRDSVNTRTMEEFRVEIKALARKCSDAKVKKELDKLAEEFKYSDPVSNDETREIENEIELKISEIKSNINGNIDAELISAIKELLGSRNSICKANK